nr:integrase, catalytic region, zinc finger, CCHC-type, peptidase aspartic, catalytic [Tanacetum cinerariifolium]
VVDSSDLQTELERMKERFENCIIKKEIEYAKLWNDWYKKCDECKFEKISYDKAYKDMQQKIERLQAQLGDLKELEFQVFNYARENAHLKTTYKNLFDSISVSCVQTETKIASLQNELQCNIYKNDKLRTHLFKKVSDQKDNTQDLSKNTKFAKQPIAEILPKIGETNALSKQVTSNSVYKPPVSKCMNNDKVIAPGMFRISTDKVSREAKKMPNTVRLDNTKTRRPQPRSNTKNDRVPSASKSSQSMNKDVKVEEHHRNLLLSKKNKHSSSAWQFCDSDLAVAFRRNACFVRNLEGVDLLKGDRSTNLYKINLHEMASASPICLMARASSTKSWLWHQRLSYLNFDTNNDLARNDLVAGLTKFKYHKEHLCPSCEQGKSKRASHPPKPVPNTRSKDEAPEVIINFLRRITNDREDIGKLGAKGDIGFFIGYSADSCAYRIYNRRTKKIMETMNVSFDELSAMSFEQRSSKPGLYCMTSVQISSGLDLTYASSTIMTQQPTEGELDL